jgi:hypothetical protein
MNLDTCPIYTCVQTKKFKHCGECEDLPCDIYYNMKDPTMSDDAHQQGIQDRVEVLTKLKK